MSATPARACDDEVMLSLDVGDAGGSIETTYSRPDRPTVCFFVAPYQPVDPVDWRVH